MLKKFFISMLGTMAGLWISLIIVVLGGLFLVGVIAGESDTVTVKKNSVLHLLLQGDIAERYQPASLVDFLQEAQSDAPSLDEMMRALRSAQTDERIAAVYLDCRGAAMGMASCEELRQAILSFKQNSGKPVYAYADSYSQGDYLLATAADSLFLNPMGAIDIHGIGGTTPFFTRALDKLGIKMQIVKVGDFKSAVEPFILTSMSEPARLQMQQYCDSLWTYAGGEIADARGLQTDTIKQWASQIMFTMPAVVFVERGLADRLAYRRQFENSLRAVAGIDSDEKLNLVEPADILSGAAANEMLNDERPHVAVLYAVGDIVDSGDEGIVGETMAPEIVDLADNDKVLGLVLRVNSGGGSAFASEQIWEALEYFKSKEKPFYVSMGDYAASGGYYISCGADKIYADETTLTGSIGVFGMVPDLSGLVTDKIGVDFSTVQTNPNTTMTILEPMTEEQIAAMQRSVETIYETFTGRVSEGRDIPVDSVLAIGGGRVWVGGKALQLGLVDKIGSLEEAIADITSVVDLRTDDIVAYPKTEEDMFVRLLRQAGGTVSIDKTSPLTDMDAETLRYMRLIGRLRTMNPIQARMEPVSIR